MVLRERGGGDTVLLYGALKVVNSKTWSNMMNNMKISDAGLTHLIKLEGGTQLVKYNDLGKDKGHCTIGVGHLIHKGVCNGKIPSEKPYLNGISNKKARELLMNDLALAENAVNRNIIVLLNVNQFDALVSFTFNVGISAFNNATLKRLINQNKFKEAADEFLIWNKMTIGGIKKEITGLTNRRIAEKSLFEKVVK